MSPPTRFSCVNGFERSRSRRGSRWGSATRRPRRYQRCRSRSPCRECRACRPRSPSCHPSASPAPRALCPRAAAHRVRMRGEGRRGVKTDLRAASAREPATNIRWLAQCRGPLELPCSLSRKRATACSGSGSSPAKPKVSSLRREWGCPRSCNLDTVLGRRGHTRTKLCSREI